MKDFHCLATTANIRDLPGQSTCSLAKSFSTHNYVPYCPHICYPLHWAHAESLCKADCHANKIISWPGTIMITINLQAGMMIQSEPACKHLRYAPWVLQVHPAPCADQMYRPFLPKN